MDRRLLWCTVHEHSWPFDGQGSDSMAISIQRWQESDSIAISIQRWQESDSISISIWRWLTLWVFFGFFPKSDKLLFWNHAAITHKHVWQEWDTEKQLQKISVHSPWESAHWHATAQLKHTRTCHLNVFNRTAQTHKNAPLKHTRTCYLNVFLFGATALLTTQHSMYHERPIGRFFFFVFKLFWQSTSNLLQYAYMYSLQLVEEEGLFGTTT